MQADIMVVEVKEVSYGIRFELQLKQDSLKEWMWTVRETEASKVKPKNFHLSNSEEWTCHCLQCGRLKMEQVLGEEIRN